jgi:hypothetical protein
VKNDAYTYQVIPLCHRWKVGAEVFSKLLKRFRPNRRHLRQRLQLHSDRQNLLGSNYSDSIIQGNSPLWRDS